MEQAVKDRESGIRPWIIVGGHRPVYSYFINNNVKDFIGDLFDKFNVDLYLAGHLHSYWRSYPINNNRVMMQDSNIYINPNSTVYVVSGGNGCDGKQTCSSHIFQQTSLHSHTQTQFP